MAYDAKRPQHFTDDLQELSADILFAFIK